MKIAVCFKLIEDYDQLPPDSWKAGGLLRSKVQPPDFKYISKVFGFFDEGALETALRLKDLNNSIELEAVSLGKENRTYTEYLYAGGYNTVTYLLGNSDFDPINTAKELSSYIEQQNFDLILTGESVGPLDSGSVPYLMAHNLKCPVIGNVSEINLQNNKIILKRDCSDSINFYEKNLEDNTPLIAVISNAKYPYLRLTSYNKREQIKNIPAKIISISNEKSPARFVLPDTGKRNAKFTDKEQIVKLLQNNTGGDRQ